MHQNGFYFERSGTRAASTMTMLQNLPIATPFVDEYSQDTLIATFVIAFGHGIS
jgi:hypothetical protein